MKLKQVMFAIGIGALIGFGIFAYTAEPIMSVEEKGFGSDTRIVVYESGFVFYRAEDSLYRVKFANVWRLRQLVETTSLRDLYKRETAGAGCPTDQSTYAYTVYPSNGDSWDFQVSCGSSVINTSHELVNNFQGVIN